AFIGHKRPFAAPEDVRLILTGCDLPALAVDLKAVGMRAVLHRDRGPVADERLAGIEKNAAFLTANTGTNTLGLERPALEKVGEQFVLQLRRDQIIVEPAEDALFNLLQGALDENAAVMGDKARVGLDPLEPGVFAHLDH